MRLGPKTPNFVCGAVVGEGKGLAGNLFKTPVFDEHDVYGPVGSPGRAGGDHMPFSLITTSNTPPKGGARREPTEGNRPRLGQTDQIDHDLSICSIDEVFPNLPL